MVLIPYITLTIKHQICFTLKKSCGSIFFASANVTLAPDHIISTTVSTIPVTSENVGFIVAITIPFDSPVFAACIYLSWHMYLFRVKTLTLCAKVIVSWSTTLIGIIVTVRNVGLIVTPSIAGQHFQFQRAFYKGRSTLVSIESNRPTSP